MCHRDWGQCQHGAAEAAEFPGGLPWEIEKGSLRLPRLLPWVGFGHLPNCLTRHATQTCLLHLLFLSFLSPSNAERNDRTNLPLKSSGRRTQLAHSESGGTRHPVVGDLFPWTCSGHSNSLTYEHCRRASSGQGLILSFPRTSGQIFLLLIDPSLCCMVPVLESLTYWRMRQVWFTFARSDF